MTESTESILTNGAGFSAGPSAGFSAGDLWGDKADYDFTDCGVKAKDRIPMPSQAKIDRFEKSCILLYAELQKIDREIIKPYEAMQDQAEEIDFNLRQAKIERNKEEIEKWRGEAEELEKAVNITEEQLDEAQSRRNAIYDHFRDATAAFCSNKPTRKQLAGVPANVLMPFINYIRGELLNPEV